MEYIEYKTVGIWEHFSGKRRGSQQSAKSVALYSKQQAVHRKACMNILNAFMALTPWREKNPEIATDWCYYWHTVFFCVLIISLRIDWTQWTETGHWIPGYYTVVSHEQSQTVWYYVFRTMLLKLALTANIFNTFLHGHCVNKGWAQSFPEFPGTIFQIPVPREFVYLWWEWIIYIYI